MISFIIWLVGVVLTVNAAINIWKMDGDQIKRILFIIILLLTSWLGLILYYIIGANKIQGWLK